MHKTDLALNNLQWLICHNTESNQTKDKYIYIYIYSIIYIVYRIIGHCFIQLILVALISFYYIYIYIYNKKK